MNTYIRDKVKNLIKQHNTNNPWELAALLEIPVIPSNLQGICDGCYIPYPSGSFIMIDSNLTSEESAFVLAHELGHALLHPDVNSLFPDIPHCINYGRIERDANLFAAHLLVADNLLHHYTNYSLKEISALEGLPLDLLKIKFC